jgi:ABC-type lipoprotein export system ATPase subunit
MLLKLQKISKSYGTPGEANYQSVLNGLDLELDHGETLAILGPSGSGKSTLLNIIGTLDRPDSGLLRFDGRDLTSYTGHELDNFRNKEIGFIFQAHHLLPQCTVLENVLLPTIVYRENSKENMEWAEDLLQDVGIWEYRNKKPGQLSGGECQRVAVVRAMINKPSLILADEPTGALDRKNVDIIADMLIELNKSNKIALLVVTHSLPLANSMSKTLELVEGKLNSI